MCHRGRQISELRDSPGSIMTTHFSSAQFIFIAVEPGILRRCFTLALLAVLLLLRNLRWENLVWALGKGSR